MSTPIEATASGGRTWQGWAFLALEVVLVGGMYALLSVHDMVPCPPSQVTKAPPGFELTPLTMASYSAWVKVLEAVGVVGVALASWRALDGLVGMTLAARRTQGRRTLNPFIELGVAVIALGSVLLVPLAGLLAVAPHIAGTFDCLRS